MKIYPYSSVSASAKSLANALGINRLKREGKPIVVKDVVINWGAARFNREITCPRILNSPDAVAIASHKLKTFKAFPDYVNTPQWTEDKEVASGWLLDGCVVVARTVLNGHSGEGIILIYPGNELVDAPLYTKYIMKKNEYRAHVFNEKVFFVQRKARNLEVKDDEVNWKIRNHANGFIFAHKDVELEDAGKEQAIMAVKSIGLDFGAVDLIKGSKDNKWYVLEVNTACGMEGTTLDKYVEQFKGVV